MAETCPMPDENDIVVRLRDAANHDADIAMAGHAEMLDEAAGEIERLREERKIIVEAGNHSDHEIKALHREIERLRGGGWTRLGAGSLPPQTGELFELRLPDDARRYFVSWKYDRELAELHPELTGVISACFMRPERDGTWTAGFTSLRAADLRRGWWRLLPGGEGPNG